MVLQRRGFLAVVATAGLGGLGGSARTAPSGTAHEHAAGLDPAAYVDVEPRGPVTPEYLQQQLLAARRELHAGHYQALGEYLPGLVARAGAFRTMQSGSAAASAAALEADSLALASEWAFKQQDAAARGYAERAVNAAQESGNIVSIGESARQLAIAMRRDGHFEAATDLLIGNAQAIAGEPGRATDQALAVSGSLLLSAAFSQAHSGNRPAAAELLGEARQCATRMKTKVRAGSFASAFGRSQVELYGIGVYHALGEIGSALELIGRVRPGSLPTDERRARYAVDAARLFKTAGLNERCVRALYALERYAPEELRRPSVRTLIEGLRNAPGPVAAGLPQLARRAGIAA